MVTWKQASEDYEKKGTGSKSAGTAPPTSGMLSWDKAVSIYDKLSEEDYRSLGQKRSSRRQLEEKWRTERNSVNDWIYRYNRIMEGVSAYDKERNGGFTRDASGGYSGRIESLIADFEGIKGFAEQYGFQDSQTYLDQLKQLQESIGQINDSFSQFEDDGEYDRYKAYMEDLEEKRNVDLDAYSRDIAALERQLEDYDPKIDWTNPTERKQYDAGLKELEDEINRRKQYLAQAQRVQKKDEFSAVANPESEKYDAAFDSKSGYVSTEQDSKLQQMLSQYSMGYGDLTYEYINNQNGIRDTIKQKAGAYKKGESPFEAKGYDYMTEDEVGLYNYYYSMGGKASAEAYLDTIQEDLNQRKAVGMYQPLEGKTGAEMIFGVEAGLDQFKGGIKGAVRAVKGDDSYVAPSAHQYASQMVREDLADDGVKLPSWLGGASLGQVGYDAITTTANMAPSIAVGMLNPTLGSAALGVSAGGNAYQEALNEGYSVDQARGYGILSGASEVVMERLLGGISAYGGNALGRFFTQNMKNADTALKRIAKELGGSMLSEFSEEYLQEVLTPVFRNLTLGTDEEVKLVSAEALYAGFLGAITGGLLEGPQAIAKGRNATQAPSNATELANKATVHTEVAQRATESATPGGVIAKNATTTVGVSKMETVQVKPDMESFAQQFGTQAEAVKRNYLEGQDLQEYEVGFQTAYAMGLEGGKADALTKVPYLSQSQREIAFSLGRDAAAAQKAAVPKKAVVTARMTTEEGTQDVTIAEVVDMDDTTMTFRLEDGRTVTDNDLDFEKGQKLMAAAWELGMDVKTVNTIVTESAVNTAADVDQAAGIQQAHHYGQYGYTMDQLTKHGTDAAALTDGQRKAAWEAGRQIYLKKSTAPAPVLQPTKASGVWFDAGGGNVRSFDAADLSGLSEAAVAGARAAQVLQKLGIGRNYYFFESYKNKAGERVYRDENGVEKKAPNGWYDPDGSIHIDLNAGANGNGLTLYTLSHELTHFVEKQDKQAYRRLAEFLVASYAKHTSVDELVMRKQAELSESRGVEVSYEDAYSEFIADSMEAMLSDGNVLEKLQELKKTDKSLFDKIREFFDNLGKKIREIYKDLTPDSLEGQAVLQMKDQIDQIQQLFAEALVEAGENFQAAAEIDLEVDMDTESVSPAVLYSERTWRESDYVQERNKAAQEISKAIGVSVKKAKQYIDSVNGIAKMIAEDRTRLDYFSSPGRSSFIGNVEYGGSFDFSTLCKKRRLLTGTFTAIQKALPNTALTANEILDIRNRMKDAGLEVSCGLCYVEGSRANMGQFAKEFLRLYKQYYPDAWQPNMADVNTPDGIEWVRINHPECYEQYEYFWNHYGTLKAGDKNLFASKQKPKLYQLHTEYKGEILQKFKGDDNVEEKNLNGGIRLQSFSDFEIVHLIDTMQIIMDMSRVGLAGQAYTKVPDFAWALGDTGLKINLSLIAKGVDESGKLIFDDIEGMPIAEAMKLRDRYSANVGTILVAFNDAQLMAAMADDRVDFIIPFHRSQWKKSQYEAMGLPAKTKDYTFMQNEKFIKPQYHEYRGRMVKDKATNYMPNEYWDFSKSGKENAEAYLQMCARNNKRPKFYKLLQNNGDGSYSLKADGSTDGYWKLLIDFKMYDNEGNGSPQAPVRPEFNMAEASRMLDDYKGGHSNFPVAQGIVDSFVSEYKENHGDRMYSDRKKKGMDDSEISAIQNIGRISVNAFTSQDIKATEKLARRYWEEMGVKSPFFRAWFGDWRVNDQTQVQIADQKGDTRGVQHNDDTGWEITVSGQVFNETKNHRGLANKSAQPYLPYINDIVRKAVLLDSYGIGVGKAKSDNSLLMHSMYAVADIGNGTEVLKLYVEEMNNPASDLTTKRSYQLQNIEKAFNASVRVQGQAPSSLTSTLNAVKIVADLFAAVKRYDTAFAPNPVSKAVNTDGTPLEMYHGTSNSGFTVFNTYGGNFGLFGKGSYFTDNPEVADSYTRKGKGQEPGVYGVYLSIKNPLDMDTHADLNAWKKAFENADLDPSYLDGVVTNEDAFRQLKENLADEEYLRWEAEDLVTELIEGMGYDGITHIGGGRYGSKDGPKHRVYIAFEPEQIKSSTDNIGTFDGSNPDIRYQDRSAGTSNRDLLAGAFEDLARSPAEMEFLQKYQENVGKLNEQERKLQEVRTEIRELTFGKGLKDPKRLAQLQEEARKTANRIDIYDKKLLRLEATVPLQRVLQRESSKAYKQGKEKSKQIYERRKDRREQAFMRQEIRKIIKRLDTLLKSETKEKHVPDSMKKAVAEALSLINDIELGTAERRMDVLSTEVQSLKQKLSQAMGLGDRELVEEFQAQLDEKLIAMQRYEKSGGRLLALRDAYADIRNSTDPDIAAGYDAEVAGALAELSESLKDTSFRDMSKEQLQDVLDMYTMVLTRIRDANKQLGARRGETLQENAAETEADIRKFGISEKDPGIVADKLGKLVRGFSWNNLRPVDAFHRLGSRKLEQLYMDLVDGMAQRGRQIKEIGQFITDIRKKTGYKSFDLKEAETYTTVDGKEMKLTLAEKMSIYAYSKRDQAYDHMAEGGFTYAKDLTYKEKGKTRVHTGKAKTWRLSMEDLQTICGSLTENQRQYVDAVQQFLTEFGTHGDKVNMELYGIKLFNKENAYFPLQSDRDYRKSVENQLGGTMTAASLKSDGMTKKTVPGANNPIVLEDFDRVVFRHLDKMANYANLVLPLENLRRVFDYQTSASENQAPASMKALIGATFGREAQQYVEQFLTDANGTRMSMGVQNPLEIMFTRSKGMAVAANLSVMIQQISAVVRAVAEISPKHLMWAAENQKGIKLYDEMVKYAPIAIIKDMGGFDTGSNRSLEDYIGFEEAPNSAKKVWNNMQKLFGMGAETMDKVGWCLIWNGVKREVASRQQYEVNSEKFLQECGKRFTEVIVKTQVYDSVLSRSGYMRDKHGTMRYLTSFMGEPTVQAGMVFNSHLDVVRAIQQKKDVRLNVKRLIRTDAALISALVVNGMLKAIPYAMRDDDEDEGYWERWAKQFGSALSELWKPWELLPILRNIDDLASGRTIEQPDMALLSDLLQVGTKVIHVMQDEEAMADMKPDDWYALAKELAGSVGNLLGVPVKNIWRDAEGYVRIWKDATDGIDSDGMLLDAMWRGLKGKEKTKHEGIYDAMVSGDTGRLDALKATYKTDGSYESAVRKALRLHDPRIKEMANARYEGDYDRLEALSYEIEAEGIFDMATIRAAYEAERTAQAKERGITLEEDSAAEQGKESTVFSMEEYYAAIRNGSKDSIQTAYNALIEEKKQEYYLEHEAEDSIASSVASKVKGEYLDEDISRADAKSILTKYGGKSKAEAETEIKKWEFQMEYHYAWGSRDRCYRSGTITRSQLVSAVMDIEDASREEAQEYVDFLELEMQNEKVDITASEASSYFEHAKPHGISVEVYLDYKARTKGIQNDKDANGDSIPYTAVQKIMTEIDKLPISSNQKYALARSNGWAEKTIQKYKKW